LYYLQNVTDLDEPLLERAQRDQDDGSCWPAETALFR